MDFIEILKAIILGMVEGLTEFAFSVVDFNVY